MGQGAPQLLETCSGTPSDRCTHGIPNIHAFSQSIITLANGFHFLPLAVQDTFGAGSVRYGSPWILFLAMPELVLISALFRTGKITSPHLCIRNHFGSFHSPCRDDFGFCSRHTETIFLIVETAEDSSIAMPHTFRSFGNNFGFVFSIAIPITFACYQTHFHVFETAKMKIGIFNIPVFLKTSLFHIPENRNIQNPRTFLYSRKTGIFPLYSQKPGI